MVRPRGGRSSNGSVDAREEINAKLRHKDARDFILSKRRQNIVDARGLISGNRKKNVRDARSIIINRQLLLSKKDRTIAIPRRTVKNDLYTRTQKTVSNSSNNRQNMSLYASMFSHRPLKKEPVSKPLFAVESTSRSRMAARKPVNMTITRDVSPERDLPTLSKPANAALSPLQGFKLQVRNLHSSVSVDDLHELFGSVGHLRQCQLIRPGFGEVVYNKKDDAISAINQYNTRELDGQPMSVQLVTERSPITAAVQRRNNPYAISNQDRNTGMDVDYETVTKALFNVSNQPNVRRPVNFVVNM